MADEINLRELSAVLRVRRGSRSLRAVAQEINQTYACKSKISASTLSRIELGKVPDLDTFICLCRWLGVSPEQFMVGAQSFLAENAEPGMSTPEIIAVHLRADQTLDPKTADALTTMIRLAYDAVARGDIGKRE